MLAKNLLKNIIYLETTDVGGLARERDS